MDLPYIIESILFVGGDPMSISRLAKLLGKKEEEISNALQELGERLEGRGVRLTIQNGEAMLVTAPEASSFVDGLIKEEFSGKLTRASLETLAIVVYKGPLTRPEIDFIRGVNSSFTLRNLLVSGLVERDVNPADKRTFIYRPSMRFLQFVGIEKLENLPEYNEFRATLEQFAEQNKDKSEAQ